MSNSQGLAHLPQAPQQNIRVQEEYVPRIAPPVNGATNIVFRLVNKQKGNVRLDGYKENVINPKTKELDTLQLIRGVYKVWKSEQAELKLDERYIRKNRLGVKFESNTAIVQSTDKVTLEFLRNCPDNIEVEGANRGSRFAFFEYDTNKQATESAAKKKARRDAVKTAAGKEIDAVKKHAMFLNIPMVNQFGILKDETALRNDYEDYADNDNNVEWFNKTIDSPEVEISYLINKALSDSKIDIRGNSLYWANNGGFICKMGTSKKASKTLIDHAMSPEEEGKLFKEQIEKLN